MAMNQRNITKEVEGIFFSLNLGAIGASSDTIYNMEDRQPTWVKYLPFDSFTLTNDSSADIIFYINMDSNQGTPLPAGVIKTITNHPIRAFRFTNDANAITDGQFRIDFERQGMTPTNLTKAMARNVFFRGLMGMGLR